MRRWISVGIVVLISVLGGGLLLYAIIQVRAAGAQAQCRNNLRQFGLSLHNYHDSYHMFPAGTMAGNGWPLERRLSWLFILLPYMEARMDGAWQDARDKPWDADESRVLTAGPYRPFVCPAGVSSTDAHGYGLTHYVGAAGVGRDAALLEAADRRAGVFGYERQTRFEDVKDGRTTTVMVIETAMANDPWAAGGPATVRGLDPEGVPYLGRAAQFGGHHRSRVTQAVFVDVSVRRLPESFTPQVFEALATITGREEIEAIPEN